MPRDPTRRSSSPAPRAAGAPGLTAGAPGLTAVALGLAAAAILAARFARTLAPSNVRIADPEGPPTIDSSGRTRSVQAAELTIDDARLAPLWSPIGLDRLARTYLRFLSRTTLGLIRVVRTPHAQLVVLLARPAVLLAFDPPAIRLVDADHGQVTWPIRGGLLAASTSRDPDARDLLAAATSHDPDARGQLRIDVRRLHPTPANPATHHLEIAVIDFRPTIAAVFGSTFYAATQARIHTVMTHTFMRSLARMRLAPPAG